MNEKAVRLIRSVYGIVLGISAVAAGICLAGACLGVYRSGGDDPFTPLAVAEAFSGIAVVVYSFLALAVGGFLLQLFLPAETKSRGKASTEMLLKVQYTKADMTTCNPELKKRIARQQKLRLLHGCISLGLLAVGSALFLIYALSPASFDTANITDCVVRAVLRLVLCLIPALGYGIFTAFFNANSIRKEYELVKLAPRQVGTAKTEQKASFMADNIVRLCILAVALTVLLYGFFAGGTADVLTKAVNICTECVGLG